MATFYITRRIKNVIMIGVVIVALIIAFNKSQIINTFLKPSDIMGQTPKKAEEMFEQSKYDTKIELKYITKDMKEIKRAVDDIIITNDLNTIYSRSSSNNIAKLVEIPRDDYKEIITSLRDHEELKSDELVQSAESAPIESLKQRIKDEEKVKEKLLNDLSQMRSVYETESLQKNLKRQNDNLDSLRQSLTAKQQQTNNVLAKIDISHFVSRADVTQYAFKSFLATFVISLLFISVALFVIYFIIILFTKLFTVLGIKTTHGKPSRYSSGSSYGYGYDYGSKKKIKRKYIRKPRSGESENSEEHKDKEDK